MSKLFDNVPLRLIRNVPYNGTLKGGAHGDWDIEDESKRAGQAEDSSEGKRGADEAQGSLKVVEGKL